MITMVAGRRYTATTTGVLRGIRVYRPVQFVASRNAKPEPLVRGSETIPDQDRVFKVDRFGSSPILVVSGTVEEVSS